MPDHSKNTVSTTALLRRWEPNVVDPERRENEARQTVETLEVDVGALKEKVGRRDQRAILAEREAGLLQPLVASFAAEELSNHDISNVTVNEPKTQRI